MHILLPLGVPQGCDRAGSGSCCGAGLLFESECRGLWKKNCLTVFSIFLIIFLMCGGVCLHVCLYATCMQGLWRQEGGVDPLGLEL